MRPVRNTSLAPRKHFAGIRGLPQRPAGRKMPCQASPMPGYGPLRLRFPWLPLWPRGVYRRPTNISPGLWPVAICLPALAAWGGRAPLAFQPPPSRRPATPACLAWPRVGACGPRAVWHTIARLPPGRPSVARGVLCFGHPTLRVRQPCLGARPPRAHGGAAC